MHKLTVVLLFLLLIKSGSIEAQETSQTIAEQAIEQSDPTTPPIDLLTHLKEIEKRPLAINRCSREELEQIPFLSDVQIENILFTRYLNGDFYTIFQMQRVEGLDSCTIKKIEPYIEFSPSEINMPYSIRTFVLWRLDMLFEKPIGYKNTIPNELPPYPGAPMRHVLKTRFTDTRNNSFALTFEKDPGETMTLYNHKPIPYISGYYQHISSKFIKHLIIGDYNLSVGHGLVVGQGNFTGKLNSINTISTRNTGIYKHGSTSENGFFRGMVAKMGKRCITFTTMVSVKELDAKLVTDSIRRITQVETLYSTGLHRTKSEIATMNSLTETIYGATTKLNLNNIHFEVGQLFTSYSYPFLPQSALYKTQTTPNQHYSNSTLSANGRVNHLFFSAEFALKEYTYPTLSASLKYKINSGGILSMQMRNLHRKYIAPRLNTLAECSSPSGEQGLLTGISLPLNNKIQASGYLDLFSYTWPKYRQSTLSSGQEWLMDLICRVTSETSLTVQVKGDKTMQNIPPNASPNTTLKETKSTAFKIQIKSKINSALQLGSRIDITKQNNDKKMAFAITQNMRWSNKSGRISATAQLTLYDVPLGGLPIYMYEPDLPYNFSSAQLTGNGAKLLTTIAYKPIEALGFFLKLERTKMSDRDEIGSGNDLITANHRTELKLQMILNF